ncbi:hypothetical protein KEM55_008496, partial [Ascosphaera atra]
NMPQRTPVLATRNGYFDWVACVSDNIDIRLRSVKKPKFDFTYIQAPILHFSLEFLKIKIQERVETTSPDGEREVVPLDRIHLLWKRHPVKGQMVSDVLGDEHQVLLSGGTIHFDVIIEGDASLRTTPLHGEIVVGPPVPANSRDDKDSSQENEPRPRLEKSSETEYMLPPGFWDKLCQFLEGQLKEHRAYQVKSMVETFRSAWELGFEN